MQSLTVTQNHYPVAPQFALSSARIVIEQADRPCCDGVNHLFIPACELEIAVCRPSRTYVAMAHMCPCGAVSTDHGKTWEKTHWAMMPSVIRDESQSTVTAVPSEKYTQMDSDVQLPVGKMAVAVGVLSCMFAASLYLDIPMSMLEKGMLATIAAPHVLPLLLKVVVFLWSWLKQLPAAVDEFLFNTGIALVLIRLRVEAALGDAWQNRPRLFRTEASAYAFAIFILFTVALAGI